MKIIITHQNADFDGLASMLGARKLWTDHHLVLGSALSPPVRKYLALHKDWLIVRPRVELGDEQITDVVVVDSRDRRRFSEFSEILEQADSVTVFDHHPAGEHDLKASEQIIEPVGACATLLCERIEEQGVELNAEEATLMMLGIYADTGNLSYPSTTVREMRAAAFLLEQGASLPVVNRYLQQEYSSGQQELLVTLMHQVKEVPRQGLRLGFASHETSSYVKGAALVVERVLKLTGLDAFFAILQVADKNSVQIIGRSRTRHVDAARVAQLWNGGGHPSAAAARVKNGTRQVVEQTLEQHLKSIEIAPLEVADVMSSPVQIVEHDMTLEKVRPMLERWGVTGVPVVKDGKLAGIVSRRDTDQAARRGDWSVPVAGFMTHKVVTVTPHQSLNEALEAMTDEDIGRLPVVEGDAIVGIITRTDVLRRLYADEEVASS